MANLSELNKIKKLYGERFMKMCREYYHTILEKEGILSGILADTFGNNSKTLYDDIHNANLEEKLKEYIYIKFDDKLNRRNNPEVAMPLKNPYELLNEAGYDLFECKTEDEIQEFKKYYTQREQLCTFRGGRLNSCVVFFAVKKNANDIKREDFFNPMREDEYGTSVMSIQFTRHTPSTLSIKNRYNHTVSNPDATYGNNLDRIVPGLTQSFEDLLSERDIKLTVYQGGDFEIPSYTMANDGRYYKYNMEINGIYYCPGNVIIEYDRVNKLENPEKQILIDYFVLDIENKEMKIVDNSIKDSFIDNFEDIEKIEVLKNKESKDNTKTILIKNKKINHDTKIIIDKNNQIIEYENNGLEEVGDDFLKYNITMKNLKFSNLKKVDSAFLSSNKILENIEAPNLETVGYTFLYNNNSIKNLKLPKLREVDDNFLLYNEVLENISVPNLVRVGDRFLGNNEVLKNIEAPNLEKVGYAFLYRNNSIKNLKLLNLKQVGEIFLYYNEVLENLEIPKLESVGNDFLYINENIKNLKLSNLQKVGRGFLGNNKIIENLEAPKLESAGSGFLRNNNSIKSLKLLNLKQVGEGFLRKNEVIETFEAPELYLMKDLTSLSSWKNKNKLKILKTPKCHELEEKLKPIIEKNNEKNVPEITITPKDIVKLDKENSITSSEIAEAKRIINSLEKDEKNVENEK